MIDLNQSLDLQDPDAQAFLAGIQGNIIKGHGRDHTAHFVLRMTGATDVVQKWVAGFAATHVTSAANARRVTAAWRSSGIQATFAGFLLSADGYRYLRSGGRGAPCPSRYVRPAGCARILQTRYEGAGRSSAKFQ